MATVSTNLTNSIEAGHNPFFWEECIQEGHISDSWGHGLGSHSIRLKNFSSIRVGVHESHCLH